jgi:hypothetical protein
VPKTTARDANGAAAPAAEVPAVPAERPRKFEPRYDPERARARVRAFIAALEPPRSRRESASVKEARRIAVALAPANMQLLIGIRHGFSGLALPPSVRKAGELAGWLLDVAGVNRPADIDLGPSPEFTAAVAAIRTWGTPTNPDDLEAELEDERPALTTRVIRPPRQHPDGRGERP